MKKVLITGGSSGLGKALARVYGENGYNILIVGRDIQKLEKTKTWMVESGLKCDYIQSDITDIESIKSMADTLEANNITIDRLINCAGVGYFAPLVDMSVDEMDNMLNVNLRGTILITQLLIGRVKGRVLNIISTAGLRGKVKEGVYCATKYGVRGFTEAMQVEYSNESPCFTAVYMGGMDTPFWDDNDHIKDKSRLKKPSIIAREIFDMDDGRKEIII